MPAPALLQVDHLTISFPVMRGLFFRREERRVTAVDDVSFTVPEGKTVGLVGESGCGKSTTARLLMNLTVPDNGDIIFDGQSVGLCLRRFAVGLVPLLLGGCETGAKRI